MEILSVRIQLIKFKGNGNYFYFEIKLSGFFELINLKTV